MNFNNELNRYSGKLQRSNIYLNAFFPSKNCFSFFFNSDQRQSANLESSRDVFFRTFWVFIQKSRKIVDMRHMCRKHYESFPIDLLIFRIIVCLFELELRLFHIGHTYILSYMCRYMVRQIRFEINKKIIGNVYYSNNMIIGSSMILRLRYCQDVSRFPCPESNMQYVIVTSVVLPKSIIM